MGRILIAEDEPGIAQFLESGLEAAGHTPLVVANGKEAAAMARDDTFDLLLLDLGLPGLDGMTVLRQIRARGDRLPVVILTARDDLTSTLNGFESGASDFVTKPFRFEELLARINVRLNTGAIPSETKRVVGSSVLDVARRVVEVDGIEHSLSSREFTLADVFFTNPGQVLSREQLLSRVWGYDFEPGSNVIDVYVGYLRKKLGSDAIETVRGAGYRLRTSPDRPPPD